MQKNKKAQSLLPRNIQLTLISTAAIAFAVQAIYMIGILARVYPQGMRLSPFSVMAICSILMPAVLFGIAFVVFRKNLPRLERLFNAAVLTLTGMAIFTSVMILQRVITQQVHTPYGSEMMATWSPAFPFIISLALFAGLLMLLQRTTAIRALQVATIVLVSVAFLSEAIFSVTALVLQHVGTKNIMNFLTHPMLITPVVLPLAFFATSYFALNKETKLNRLFGAVIYSLVGALVVFITLTFFYISTWTLSLGDTASVYALDLQTIFASIISIAVFTFLIITHNRSKQSPKKKK